MSLKSPETRAEEEIISPTGEPSSGAVLLFRYTFRLYAPMDWLAELTGREMKKSPSTIRPSTVRESLVSSRNRSELEALMAAVETLILFRASELPLSKTTEGVTKVGIMFP